MKYIIAAIEGIRHDIAPEYTGKYGKIYHYGNFDLLIHICGDYYFNEYDKAYKEISDYCKKVNNDLKNNNFYRGWYYAEMLTPNERNEYNDIRCKLFHTWYARGNINSIFYFKTTQGSGNTYTARSVITKK